VAFAHILVNGGVVDSGGVDRFGCRRWRGAVWGDPIGAELSILHDGTVRFDSDVSGGAV
jgi:hypothetical protein